MEYFFGFLLGVLIGIAGLTLTFIDHPSEAYKQQIVCENYMNGQFTVAGCVVDKQVVEVKVR